MSVRVLSRTHEDESTVGDALGSVQCPAFQLEPVVRLENGLEVAEPVSRIPEDGSRIIAGIGDTDDDTAVARRIRRDPSEAATLEVSQRLHPTLRRPEEGFGASMGFGVAYDEPPIRRNPECSGVVIPAFEVP